jgi:hypothetical protein
MATKPLSLSLLERLFANEEPVARFETRPQRQEERVYRAPWAVEGEHRSPDERRKGFR